MQVKHTLAFINNDFKMTVITQVKKREKFNKKMENLSRKFEIIKTLNGHSRTKKYISEILTPTFLFYFHQGIHYVFVLITLKLEEI